ncbi:MAG: aconitate hydratase 2/2-methylisocitrate dehydratase [Planctomycetota bacterium]
MASILGKLPSLEEYREFMAKLDPKVDEVYRYLNFNELPQFVEASASAGDSGKS